jgi:hypothetical protein
MKRAVATGPISLPPLARYVDERMGHICQQFDWLEAVTPWATQALWEHFRASGFSAKPRFRYRDPGIDLDRTRNELQELPTRYGRQPVSLATRTASALSSMRMMAVPSSSRCRVRAARTYFWYGRATRRTSTR